MLQNKKLRFFVILGLNFKEGHINSKVLLQNYLKLVKQNIRFASPFPITEYCLSVISKSIMPCNENFLPSPGNLGLNLLEMMRKY